MESENKAVKHSVGADIAEVVAVGVFRDVLPKMLLGHADVRALDALLEVAPEAFNAVRVVNASDVFVGAVIDREMAIRANSL